MLNTRVMSMLSGGALVAALCALYLLPPGTTAAAIAQQQDVKVADDAAPLADDKQDLADDDDRDKRSSYPSEWTFDELYNLRHPGAYYKRSGYYDDDFGIGDLEKRIYYKKKNAQDMMSFLKGFLQSQGYDANAGSRIKPVRFGVSRRR